MKEINLPKGLTALVDDEDFERLNIFTWSVEVAPRTYYVRRRIRNCVGMIKAIWMHHEVMGVIRLIDHIDGNGLNNTRSNLRFCTIAQNQYNSGKHANNTSGLKGVSWHKKYGCWQAQVKYQGKKFYLGQFKDKFHAAHAYNDAAQRLHGDFARLNEI